MGNLLPHRPKRLFPDHLRRDLPDRLVGDGILVEKAGTHGQHRKNRVQNQIQIGAVEGGNRHGVRKPAETPVSLHGFGDFFFSAAVRLVNNQDNRKPRTTQKPCDVLLRGAHIIARLNQPENRVHILQRLLRGVHHVLAQAVFCLMDARRIQKHNLPARVIIDGADPVSGRLGFSGCNGDFLSDQMIHQRGLADIRPADHGHIPGF